MLFVRVVGTLWWCWCCASQEKPSLSTLLGQAGSCYRSAPPTHPQNTHINEVEVGVAGVPKGTLKVILHILLRAEDGHLGLGPVFHCASFGFALLDCHTAQGGRGSKQERCD